jgi:hypothetical protein
VKQQEQSSWGPTKRPVLWASGGKRLRTGINRPRFGGGFRLPFAPIHRTSWKGRSPKLASRIPHTPGPMGPETPPTGPPP